MAAKRSKKKKKSSLDVNIAVVVLVLFSILLMILIYTKSGSMGRALSPALGGIMGFIKYVIPIGMLLIAISMTHNEKDYFMGKLMQYVIFLLCICAMLSVFQVSKGNLSINKDFAEIVDEAYTLGERDIGGGVIGTIIAIPLINMLGTTGAAILTVGISIILIIFIFGIKPAEIIGSFLDELAQRKQEYQEEKVQRYEHELKNTVAMPKETKKERKRREKEEAIKLAAQIGDELASELNQQEEKKYDYEQEELDIPSFFDRKKVEEKIEKKQEPEEVMSSPDVIDANLFQQEEEQKEDKVKEVLQL